MGGGPGEGYRPFSNRIVGYASVERMTTQQFRARSFRAVLTAAGLRGSMGCVASAGDNAALESWHALKQKNVPDRRRWRTRDERHQAIVFWIEHAYNRRRRQRALGKLTPVEFELAFTSQAVVAA